MNITGSPYVTLVKPDRDATLPPALGVDQCQGRKVAFHTNVTTTRGAARTASSPTPSAAARAVGAVFIRFAVAGVILCVAERPRFRGLGRSGWGTVTMLACALTVMNLCFYQAWRASPSGSL
jgi:threonine/homoserine efflux transporter RhtA